MALGLQFIVESRGVWSAVVSNSLATIVEAVRGPVRNARSSTLPRLCVITPLSDRKVKWLASSQSIKGLARGDVRSVKASHLV